MRLTLGEGEAAVEILRGIDLSVATGETLAAYAKENIVDPAGFAGGLFWMTDLTGGNIGGCCLSIRLSD